MYVCMCVCLYVCTSVCIYVCMYVRMYVRTYVRMYVCLYVCMYMRVCVGAHTHIPTYYIYIYIHTYYRCMYTVPLCISSHMHLCIQFIYLSLELSWLSKESWPSIKVDSCRQKKAQYACIFPNNPQNIDYISKTCGPGGGQNYKLFHFNRVDTTKPATLSRLCENQRYEKGCPKRSNVTVHALSRMAPRHLNGLVDIERGS